MVLTLKRLSKHTIDLRVFFFFFFFFWGGGGGGGGGFFKMISIASLNFSLDGFCYVMLLGV